MNATPVVTETKKAVKAVVIESNTFAKSMNSLAEQLRVWNTRAFPIRNQGQGS